MVIKNEGRRIDVYTPMVVGGVQLDGVRSVSEKGGQIAPERKTEKGFPYASYIGPEAREVTAEVTLHPPNRRALSQLRTKKEPFPVLLAFARIEKCKLVDLTVNQEHSIKSHYTATIKVKQVKEVLTGSADLVVDNRDGQGNGSKKTQSSDEPSTTSTSASESKETRSGDDVPTGEQIVNDIPGSRPYTDSKVGEASR